MAGTREQVDGRRLRGERRRQALIDATLRVIERDGVAGVTHRSVAAEARLPKTAATYYFATIDELLVAALIVACEGYTESLRQALESETGSVDRFAELLAEAAAHRVRMVAEYELYLLAARRPALRAAARSWVELATEFVRRHTDDPVIARSTIAVMDGMLLETLFDERPPSADEFRAVLRHVLRRPR